MKKSKLLLILVVLGLAVVVDFTLSKTYATSFYDTIKTKYEGAVERLADLEIVSGTSANVFSPEKKVTRAEFAKMLVQSALTKAERKALSIDDGSVTKFKDVYSGDWYYEYVTIAINNNFMKGYDDGTFRPNKDVSYSEIAKMVTRALGHLYLSESDPRGWDAQYLDKAWDEGLFKYVDFKSPSESATRGNVANIIWNMLRSNLWELDRRNDKTGFTYVDSGKKLIDVKVVDHVALIDARIGGYTEINGEVWVLVNESFYKIFDQKSKVNFSTIGGYSDILLKRVEYPGKNVKLEVVGISTDIGSQLYAGTYKELTSDKFKLKNTSKLSPDADYAFLYHYEDKPEDDRNVSINLSNTYVIDKVNVTDKAYPKIDTGEEEDKSHSSVPNEFVDDPIAYRYDKKIEGFERTIDINDGEAVFSSGALVFKDNERVQWGSVKKDDVLVEITPGMYYFVQTGNDREVRVVDISNEKDNNFIEIPTGKLDAYPSTLFADYFSNTFKRLKNLKKDELDNLIGRRVKITQDISDRVAKIELLEDDITFEDVKIGFYESFSPQNNSTGLLKIFQDGKTKSLTTSNDGIKADKGNLIKYEYEENSTKYVKSIQIINGSIKLTDKIKIEPISIPDLQSKLRYFDDSEITITMVSNHYKFAAKESIEDVNIEQVLIDDIFELPNDKELKCFVMLDGSGVIRHVFVFDSREKETRYFGILARLYRDSKEKKDFAKLYTVGIEKEQDLIVKDPSKVECNIGDFVTYKIKGTDEVEFGERFEPRNLGYFKDLIVKSENIENKDVVSYNLSDGASLELDSWTIYAFDQKFRLKNYEVFLLNVSLDKEGKWRFDKASRITKDKPNFKINDRIAINEIEGTAIVYRGFTE